MAPADFLTEKRNEIAARLKELEPLVDEYRRLEVAAAALDGAFDAASSSTTGSRRRTRAPAATSPRARGASHGGGGRPRGSGTRAAEAVALVSENPGITIPEIAEKMGIRQNYLYRVLPSLAEEGLVFREGRGWWPKTPQT
ncbi:MAG: hypothetical protein QOG94_811 [Solirubrobacteraceae bacterium]|jgi:CRP-like cAMP-binding protein|nr:hypothetical protein [Solirubrobacteraceae bacterium]MEA2138650.1 hypothetical protein [Solirubrobacteraceae bacterium]